MERKYSVRHPASICRLQRTAYEGPLEREKNPFQKSTEVGLAFYLLYWDKLAVVQRRSPLYWHIPEARWVRGKFLNDRKPHPSTLMAVVDSRPSHEVPRRR